MSVFVLGDGRDGRTWVFGGVLEKLNKNHGVFEKKLVTLSSNKGCTAGA